MSYLLPCQHLQGTRNLARSPIPAVVRTTLPRPFLPCPSLGEQLLTHGAPSPAPAQSRDLESMKGGHLLGQPAGHSSHGASSTLLLAKLQTRTQLTPELQLLQQKAVCWRPASPPASAEDSSGCAAHARTGTGRAEALRLLAQACAPHRHPQPLCQAPLLLQEAPAVGPRWRSCGARAPHRDTATPGVPFTKVTSSKPTVQLQAVGLPHSIPCPLPPLCAPSRPPGLTPLGGGHSGGGLCLAALLSQAQAVARGSLQ